MDEVKNKLCQILSQRKQLVVIFEFDSPRHHGALESAILEALINGESFLQASLRTRLVTFQELNSMEIKQTTNNIAKLNSN